MKTLKRACIALLPALAFVQTAFADIPYVPKPAEKSPSAAIAIAAAGVAVAVVFIVRSRKK